MEIKVPMNEREVWEKDEELAKETPGFDLGDESTEMHLIIESGKPKIIGGHSLDGKWVVGGAGGTLGKRCQCDLRDTGR